MHSLLLFIENYHSDYKIRKLGQIVSWNIDSEPYVSDFYEEDTSIYEPEGLNLTPSRARYLRDIVRSRPS